MVRPPGEQIFGLRDVTHRLGMAVGHIDSRCFQLSQVQATHCLHSVVIPGLGSCFRSHCCAAMGEVGRARTRRAPGSVWTTSPGVTGAFVLQGQALDDYSIVSDSGFDYLHAAGGGRSARTRNLRADAGGGGLMG